MNRGKPRGTAARDDRAPQESQWPAQGDSFVDIVLASARREGGVAPRHYGVEPLEHLEYTRELAIKSEAIREFWKRHGLEGAPGSVVASPRPRGYRTTSKRRVNAAGRRVSLLLDRQRAEDGHCALSKLEPPGHLAIYEFVHRALNQARMRDIAEALNFVIIRGGYRSYVVVFNVCGLDGVVVRGLKALAGSLVKGRFGIESCFVYLDESRSEYYLDSLPTDGGLRLKKLFGSPVLGLEVEGRRLLYPPTVFSQVNESMVPVMIRNVRDLLAMTTEYRLLDLYCGYGLFAHAFAAEVGQVVGADAAREAVGAAIESAKHFKIGNRARFLVGDIDENFVHGRLPPDDATPELVVLDPPRAGTSEGVIAALAERGIERAVHVFCNVDRIPVELKQWAGAGYRVRRVVPLDMFPGVPALEVLVLVSPRA